MADFNVNLPDAQAAGARPVAPVQRITDPTIGAVANLASIFIQNQAEAKKKEQMERDQATVSEFTRKQTALSDAIATGQMTRAQALARSRTNFSEYSANSPHLVEQLSKTNKDLFENTGLEEAASERKQQLDLQKNLFNSMQTAGYPVYPGMPQKLFEPMYNAYITAVRSDEDFKRLAQRRQENRAAAGEERQRTEFEIKQQAGQLLGNLGDTHMKSFNAFITDRIAVAQRDPAQAQNIILQLNQEFAKIDSQITSAATFNPELASGYRNIFANLKKMGEDAVSGKLGGDALEQQRKNLENQIYIQSLGTQSGKQLKAMSYLAPNNLPSVFLDLNVAGKAVIDSMASGYTPGGIPPAIVVGGDPQTEDASYAVISGKMKDIKRSGREPTAEEATSISNSVNNILAGVEIAGSRGGAKSLAKVAGFLSSTEYADIVAKGLIDRDTAARANMIFNTVYRSEVVEGLQRKMDETVSVRPGQTSRVGDVVDVQWNGAGVSFVPKVANRGDVAASAAERNRISSQLNSSTQVLNQLIKAGAHQEGHTNYAQYWEKNKEQFLPGMFPAEGETKLKAKAPAAPTTQSRQSNWWSAL